MKKWDANTLSGVSNEQYFDYQDLIWLLCSASQTPGTLSTQ